MVPEHLIIALDEIGVKERAGDEDNPKILQYLDTIELEADHDEVPWCSAFVNWVLLQANIKGTYKGLARSWLNWGKETSSPKLGDIVVLWRDKKNSYKGHVGFFLDMDSKYVYLLGGNQANKVSIRPYPKSRVLSFRRYHGEQV